MSPATMEQECFVRWISHSPSVALNTALFQTLTLFWTTLKLQNHNSKLVLMHTVLSWLKHCSSWARLNCALRRLAIKMPKIVRGGQPHHTHSRLLARRGLPGHPGHTQGPAGWNDPAAPRSGPPPSLPLTLEQHCHTAHSEAPGRTAAQAGERLENGKLEDDF